MAYKIEARCPVNEETLLEAMQEMWKQDFKVLEYMRMAGWFVLPFSVYIAATSPKGPLGGLPWLILGLMLVFATKIQIFKARGQIRKFKLLGTEAVWTFTPEGTEQVTGEETTKETWEGYHRVIRTPRGFLLYPQKGRVYWLPQSAFTTSKDMETLEKYISARVKDFKHKK